MTLVMATRFVIAITSRGHVRAPLYRGLGVLETPLSGVALLFFRFIRKLVPDGAESEEDLAEHEEDDELEHRIERLPGLGFGLGTSHSQEYQDHTTQYADSP